MLPGHDVHNLALFTDLYELTMLQAYVEVGMAGASNLQSLHTPFAEATKLPAGLRPGRRPELSGEFAFRRGKPRVPGLARQVQGQLPCLATGLPLHRGCARGPGGYAGFRQRADPRDHRADCRSPARRNFCCQSDSPANDPGLQGRTGGHRGARSRCRRFRRPTHPRDGCRHQSGASVLHRGRCRNLECPGRQDLWSPGDGDDGAQLRSGVGRRERRLPVVRSALSGHGPAG